MLIEDILTENTMTFLATDIKLLQSVEPGTTATNTGGGK